MVRALRIERGSDLVLYLRRKECALNLEALGEAAGSIDYGSVAAAVHRFDRRFEPMETVVSKGCSRLFR